MHALFSKQFRKKYKLLPEAIRLHFNERLVLFISNQSNPVLNMHPLHGTWIGHRSINVTGSYRAIYYHINKDTVMFVAIGTHPELYGE